MDNLCGYSVQEQLFYYLFSSLSFPAPKSLTIVCLSENCKSKKNYNMLKNVVAWGGGSPFSEMFCSKGWKDVQDIGWQSPVSFWSCTGGLLCHLSSLYTTGVVHASSRHHYISSQVCSLPFLLMFTAGFLWGLFRAHGKAGMMSSVLSPEQIMFCTSIHVNDVPVQ